MSSLPLLFVAFSGGLASFFSPCVLPLVVPYLCFMASVSLETVQAAPAAGTVSGLRRRLLLHAVCFSLGFSLVFIAMGASATALGLAFRHLMAWTVTLWGMEIGVLNVLAGLIIMLMGAHFLGIFRISALLFEKRYHPSAPPPGLWGAFWMGFAFACGWTPCIGPVLAVVLTMASLEESAFAGMGLLGVYALGLALPFWAAAYFMTSMVQLASRMGRFFPLLEATMGVFLILLGGLVMTGNMTRLTGIFLQYAPWAAKIG